MKRIYIFLLLCFATKAFSQATLPTSWNMGDANNSVNNPPTGWSYKLDVAAGNLVYTGAGFFVSSPQALRLDGTGEWLQVYFANRPSAIKGQIRSTGTTGFTGVFDLQESVDGSNWSTVYSWNNSMPNAMTAFSYSLKSTSRYVRFYYTTKGSGFNVALDDVEVTAAGASTNPEISLQYKSNILVNNSEVFSGNDSTIFVKIKNKSIGSTLNYTSNLSSSIPNTFQLFQNGAGSILKGDSVVLKIRKLAGLSGTRKGILTLNSNDSAGNATMVLNLYSIEGNLATEPTNPSMTGNLSGNAWSLTHTIGSSSENIIVLSKIGSSLSEVPVDGVTYDKGGYIGTSRIVYIGAASSYKIDNILANTGYLTVAFAFNGKLGFENYNTTSPITHTFTTPGLNAGSYYSGVSNTANTFVTDLRTKIRPHFQVFYSNYPTTIIQNFEAYDTTQGRKAIKCYYTGYKYLYVPPFKFDTMSREHAYPYSWMGEGSVDSANYSDLHILFPVHQNKANAIRSNYTLNNLKSVNFSFLNGKLGLDSSGNIAYEPSNETKGIVARANFYICATYNRTGKVFTIPTGLSAITEKQDQNVLKRWHFKYPVSNREIARHEYIASVQNNRNPFIDNPNWACYINFSNMSYVSAGDACGQGGSANISKTIIKQLLAYPNPGNLVSLNLQVFTNNSVQLKVYDITENLVKELSVSNSQYQLDISNLSSGKYLLIATSGNETALVNLVKP